MFFVLGSSAIIVFNLLGRLPGALFSAERHKLAFNVLQTRAGYHWMNVAALALLLLGPLGVLLRILLVGVPGAAVVCKLQLIDHHDALMDRTGLRAFVAPSAVFVCNIVQPVAGLVKTLVGTFQPAERALGAKVKAHDRPLILCRAALKCLVARLALRPQFELASHGRNRSSFQELEPFRQNGNF